MCCLEGGSVTNKTNSPWSVGLARGLSFHSMASSSTGADAVATADAADTLTDRTGEGRPFRTIFFSFGAGSRAYEQAVRRICHQARATGCFDVVREWTASDLRADIEFWSKHGAFVESNPRGFGYWIWKSHLFLRALETMSDGDVGLYLDAGCEFTQRGNHFIRQWQQKVRNDGVMLFTYAGKRSDWTKMDLLQLMPPSDWEPRLVQAGLFMFRKDASTIRLAQRWFELCTTQDYHFVDDSPSVAPNTRGFKEHRHDQSCLSTALSLEGIRFQGFPLNLNPKNTSVPFFAARNRSGRYMYPVGDTEARRDT